MWEKVRVDGKKKLKANAVSTVFYSQKKIHEDIPEKNSHNVCINFNFQCF